MANTRQKIDRWATSENAVLNTVQTRTSRTPTTEFNSIASMSTNTNSHHDS